MSYHIMSCHVMHHTGHPAWQVRHRSSLDVDVHTGVDVDVHAGVDDG